VWHGGVRGLSAQAPPATPSRLAAAQMLLATAAFAVASILRWWQVAGQTHYPRAGRLLITADGGGSNGSRVRLWKWEWQRLADEIGLAMTVCHYPPGTSKWNKIEHRLFAFISQNWRSRPLVSYAVMLRLIAATTAKTGLQATSYLDTNVYPTGMTATRTTRKRVSAMSDPEVTPRLSGPTPQYLFPVDTLRACMGAAFAQFGRVYTLPQLWSKRPSSETISVPMRIR
jgi:hypothetical protein